MANQYNWRQNRGHVTAMQNILYRKGYLKNLNDVDGYWGPKTANAVRAMQADLKKAGKYSGNIDGDWGPLTEQAVQAVWGEKAVSGGSGNSSTSSGTTPKVEITAEPTESTRVTPVTTTTKVPRQDMGLGTHINSIPNYTNYPTFEPSGFQGPTQLRQGSPGSQGFRWK